MPFFLVTRIDRIIYSSDALTFLSEARQSTLLTQFLDALTRGGPSGLPRPIELHAHDPIRYAGDMLAWVHQAIAAECEFLESLFGLNGQTRMVGAVRTFNGSEEEEWVKELLNSSVSKLCVPLKVRATLTRATDFCFARSEAHSLEYRFGFCRLYERRRAVLHHTRSPIFCNTTCSLCNGR